MGHAEGGCSVHVLDRAPDAPAQAPAAQTAAFRDKPIPISVRRMRIQLHSIATLCRVMRIFSRRTRRIR